MKIRLMTKSSKKFISDGNPPQTGYCVAGLVYPHNGTRQWIRLVSDEEGASLIEKYLTYNTTNGPRQYIPMNVIEIPDSILHEQKLPFQDENYLLDLCKYKPTNPCIYEKDADIKGVINEIGFDFVNEPVYLNTKEFLTKEEMEMLHGKSLAIVNVENPVVTLSENSEGKLKTKISFTHNNEQYNNFSVTDRKFFCKTNEELISLNDSLKNKNIALVVSLPNIDLNGLYCKFVAKIFCY